MVHRLQGPGGGEGPAGAAPALVLDRSDRPLLSPVHTARQRPSVGRQQVARPVQPLLLPGSVSVHGGDKLVAEEVAELIHGKFVRVNALNV